MFLISFLFSKILLVPVPPGEYKSVGACRVPSGKPNKNGFLKVLYTSGSCYLAPTGRIPSSNSALITVAEENTFSFSMMEIPSPGAFIRMNSTELIDASNFKIEKCAIANLKVIQNEIVFSIDGVCPEIIIPAGSIKSKNGALNSEFRKQLQQEISPQVENTVELPQNAIKTSVERDPSSRLPQSIQVQPEESVFSSSNNIVTASPENNNNVLNNSASQNTITVVSGNFGQHTIRLRNLTSKDEIVIPESCGRSTTANAADGSFQVTTDLPCSISINGSMSVSIK